MIELVRDLRAINVLAKFENDPWKIVDVRVLTGLFCPAARPLGRRQYPGALDSCGVKMYLYLIKHISTQPCQMGIEYIYSAWQLINQITNGLSCNIPWPSEWVFHSTWFNQLGVLFNIEIEWVLIRQDYRANGYFEFSHHQSTKQVSIQTWPWWPGQMGIHWHPPDSHHELLWTQIL